jgi:TonB family protein
VAALIGRIEQAKRYPFAARRAGIEGVVTMRVRIDEAGRIAGYSVQPDGAPHRWLQEASLETMTQVDPQLLPEGRLEAALVVEVPIRFHLR